MFFHIRYTVRHLAAASAILTILTAAGGCESVTEPPPVVFEEGTITVDASSQVQFAYVDLANGTVITSPDPGASTDWHIAFRRFSVRLNGGVAGPGAVDGYNVANNAGATAEEVAALAPEDGQSSFEAVTEANIPDAASFVSDELVPDPGASWFRFDHRTGSLVANPGAAWKARESSGRGFAIFRVVELLMEGERPIGGTVEFRRQSPDGTLGASGSLEVDLRRGPVFLSFADGPVANPAGCGWDLGVTPDLAIQVNADCGAGTFPLDASEDFTAVTRADDAPDYGGFLSTISGAFPATVDDANGTFWYDVQGNSRMWPTYNVFLVRADQAVYKVQITDYYDATGTSGHPTLKYKQLR